MRAEKVAAVGGNSTPCGLNGLSGVGGPPPTAEHGKISYNIMGFHSYPFRGVQQEAYFLPKFQMFDGA